MGDVNSSVTRVWPVFECLLHADATGAAWLPRLLQMGSEVGHAARAMTTQPGELLPRVARMERPLPGPLKRVLGPVRAAKLSAIRNAFEENICPSANFLRWLIEHPEEMKWPVNKGENEGYGTVTQTKRAGLFGGDPVTKREALAAWEAAGAGGSRRKWWAFEGFTSVDCLLETERLVLLIEGKRTESIAPSTRWFPKRNQIIRNLEVARELAGGRKDYAVLICSEKEVRLKEEVWADSLPHLAEEEREELRGHFLGCVTWARMAKELCEGMVLPNGLDEAVDLCLSYR